LLLMMVVSRVCVVMFVGVVLMSGVSADFDFRDHLASMTPYANRQSPILPNDYEPPQGCKLVSLDMVLRHGSRNPTDKSVQSLDTLYKHVQKHVSELKFDWMKQWKNKFLMDEQGLLCERGVQEHHDLGVNASRFFKDAVLPYNANEVKFTCTYKDRTSQSAESFGNAMVNDEAKTPIAVTSLSKEDDIFLRFFENCPRYRAEVKDNPKAKLEAKQYFSKVVPTIAQHVTERSGLPLDSNAEQYIDIMWTACQSEYVAFDITDHWCTVFTEEDIRALEFYDDLSAFYAKSYGIEISYKIASPLLADIISNMENNANPIKDDVPIRANLRFGHAETMLPFTALLGLFHTKNETLTANMTQQQIDNREFRFGAISPLASNVAFVQYKCEGKTENDVEVLHNGVMYPIRNCSDRLCPLSKFKELFSEELDIAKKFADYCKVKNTNHDEL